MELKEKYLQIAKLLGDAQLLSPDADLTMTLAAVIKSFPELDSAFRYLIGV